MRSLRPQIWIAIVALAVVALVALFASRRPYPNAIPTSAQVWARVMSPYCEGLTLEECPSSESVELRREIAAKVAAGWTNAQIDEWLVANFGEAVLGRPASAWSWSVPILIFGSGALMVWIFSRKLSGRTREAFPEIDEGQLERVRSDFREFVEETTE